MSMRYEANWCRRLGMYDALAAEGRVRNIIRVKMVVGRPSTMMKMEEGVRFEG